MRNSWSVSISRCSEPAGIQSSKPELVISSSAQRKTMGLCSATLLGGACGRLGAKPWLGKGCSVEEADTFVF